MDATATKRHARDWSIDVKLPPEHAPAIVRDVFSGMTALELSGTHPNVVLCALPKSGSLFATELLSCALGLRNHQIGFQGKGGTLYYPRLLLAKFVKQGTLSHCHQPATADALQLFARLQVRPLVLLRDIPDALISRRDMLARDRWCANLLAPRGRERYFALDEEQQLDVVIDLFAADFLGFTLGWLAQAGRPSRPVFARYEELVRDEPAFVTRVAGELGLACDLARARQASEEIRAQGGINFSTGRVGRGRELFRPRQLERLRTLAHTLGAEDLAALGL